jgi:succinate dehydrogenase / fumarate reductase membrane anchor subunit
MDFKARLEKAGQLLIINKPTQHWWYQRLSAVALLPLTLWFLLILSKASHAPYAETAAWIGQPFNTLIGLIFIIAAFYHAALGVQVVIEDYIPDISLRHRLIIAANLIFLIFGATASLSIITIFLLR